MRTAKTAFLLGTIAFLLAGCGPDEETMNGIAQLSSNNRGAQALLKKGSRQPQGSLPLQFTLSAPESFQLYLTAIVGNGDPNQIPVRSPVPGYWRVQWNAGNAPNQVAFIDASGSTSIPLHASYLKVDYIPSSDASEDIQLGAFVGEDSHATYPPPTYTAEAKTDDTGALVVQIPPFARVVSINFVTDGAANYIGVFRDSNGNAIGYLTGNAVVNAYSIYNVPVPGNAQDILISSAPPFTTFTLIFQLGF